MTKSVTATSPTSTPSLRQRLDAYPNMSDKIRYLYYVEKCSKSAISTILSAEYKYVRFQWVYNVLKEPLKVGSPFAK